MSTPAATCNGGGSCPASEPQQCGRFACQGATCGSGPCAADSDCSAGYRCDTDRGDCTPTSTICDVDGKTLRKPDGSTTDCTPFVCRGNACTTACSTDSDCASGNSCKSGVCGPKTGGGFDLDLTGNKSWFCSVSERREGYGHGAFMALIALGLLARRRPRAAR
jgi:MYXO-CTERM domain-containing protein